MPKAQLSPVVYRHEMKNGNISFSPRTIHSNEYEEGFLLRFMLEIYVIEEGFIEARNVSCHTIKIDCENR